MDYTIYYDETNNIRTFYLDEVDFNVQNPSCFVLGGITHVGAAKPLDIGSLRATLRLQANVKEIKLKHLGKGDFLSLLTSNKISKFLEWLESQEYFVHFHVIDPIYWSVVDVIDSIDGAVELGEIRVRALKNTLHCILRSDLAVTADVMGRYEYPNVGVRRDEFLDEVIALVEKHIEAADAQVERTGDIEVDLKASFDAVDDFIWLKSVLEDAKGKNLDFLEDECPRVLINEMGIYYAYQMGLFPTSQHIFDREDRVEQYLSSGALGDVQYFYRFTNSESDVGIQISDVFVGLLGKAFTYCSRTPIAGIMSDLANMSPIQVSSLAKLAGIIDRSVTENPHFAHRLLSNEDLERSGFLLDPIRARLAALKATNADV